MFEYKSRLAIFSSIFLLSAFAILFICKKKFSAQHDTQKKQFFALAPIIKFASLGAPCLEIQIEDKAFIMELDLGFRGHLAMSSKFVNEISSKSFLGTKPMYGFRGHAYETNLYRIPEIRIGPLSLWQIILQEECEQSRLDSILVKKTEAPLQREPGKLGWELFYHFNLLIDMNNAKVAFCDGLDSLKKRGYPTDAMVSMPLIEERGLIEFDAITPNGSLRCVLDTGCTWNILNMETKEDVSSSKNTVEIESFKIGKQDFGPISFQRVPIQIPIHVEAILGMEFFKEHLVFIDFSQAKIYFLKYPTPRQA